MVAGLTLASSTSVAHDLYNSVDPRGPGLRPRRDPGRPIAAVIIGAVAIGLSIYAQKLNIAFLRPWPSPSRSANSPAIIYNLFWRKFNTVGAVEHLRRLRSPRSGWWSSPSCRGRQPSTRRPGTPSPPRCCPLGVDFSWFPLENPGTGRSRSASSSATSGPSRPGRPSQRWRMTSSRCGR
ncbi:MAG: hypothetical protein R2734_04325 [Nocardioides sp.]